MSKKISAETDARIIKEIGRHAEGIGMDSLHAYVEDVISRRSLQRRLARFVSEGRLVREGKQRGARYRPAPITAEISEILPALSGIMIAEVYIPISPEGNEIRGYVRQPRQMRTPVGYNQSFLEAYYPNETSYLPAELRRQLHTLRLPMETGLPAPLPATS